MRRPPYIATWNEAPNWFPFTRSADPGRQKLLHRQGSEQQPGKAVHRGLPQVVERPPSYGARLVVVGARHSRSDCGFEHSRDVGDDIAIGVSDLEPAPNASTSRPSSTTTPASSCASRTPATRGDSCGSIAPPIVCHCLVSISWTSRRRPPGSMGRTQTEGKTKRSWPTFSRKRRI